ncbi:hydrogenase expression/formation protein HypE [Helicobacter sp. WB40]|uniref:hydrogenase expression/formation protein HypE n=1 Tax=Helicobacter sp. WB40 TaxID=3004130 RepID=UPI0022EC0DD7|nr:hydrogenase expression/formation protein HypE [Helicobacter sp. WB40]MDA3967807.1 hydrogenase expression/formation protein HypE [Helicobacter sp. WB40]
MKMQSVQLSHGSGGVESQKLINDIFYKHLQDLVICGGEDAGVFETNSKLAVSTDGYTISPIFFEGGDIGKLSIYGSCNDVSMMGAKPQYITASFMIEEGFLFEELEKIVISFSAAIKECNVKLISGDTKVLPKGTIDKMFITTTAIGEIVYPNLSAFSLQSDCSIIVSGTIGDHGAVIFSKREEIEINSNLQSDCAFLYPMLESLFTENINIYALRDSTRGGIASVLNEWANSSNVGIEINEEKLPIKNEVRGICEMLGFEAYNLANEGMCVLCVSKKDELKTLEILRNSKLGQNAQIIGQTTNENKKQVIFKTSYGARRYLEYPSGELLPRIC